MKKCKACKGKGFTSRNDTSKLFFGISLTRDTGLRVQCDKCFGKGFRNEQVVIRNK